MYTNARNAALSYANVGLETGVVAASPHKLIVMLYEGAELSVRMAIKHLNDGELEKKSAAITKASTIILDGLHAALDFRQGGDLADQLSALYGHMNKQLMLAHVHNQVEPLHEVLGLLRELRGAWQLIGASGHAAPHATYHSLAA